SPETECAESPPHPDRICRCAPASPRKRGEAIGLAASFRFNFQTAPLRHCERSEARFGGRGRRYAHRNGGARDHECLFSRRNSPEFCTLFALLKKSEGAGKAGWPLHPGLPRKENLRERVNHRYGGDHTGPPCAMVLRLIGALPGEPFRLPPSPA